jgi:glyoxylase-like metal-dependent hydrolase (beta-lactamase superfamily II)
VRSAFGHHLTDRQKRAYSLERETQLESGLAELGLSHNSIDWIVLSHLHLDHAGGVLSSDGAAFPNTGSSFDRLEALHLVHEVDGPPRLSLASRSTSPAPLARSSGHRRHRR